MYGRRVYQDASEDIDVCFAGEAICYEHPSRKGAAGSERRADPSARLSGPEALRRGVPSDMALSSGAARRSREAGDESLDALRTGAARRESGGVRHCPDTRDSKEKEKKSY